MILSNPPDKNTSEPPLQQHYISLSVKIFLSIFLLGAIFLFAYLGYLMLYDTKTDIIIYISTPLILLLVYGCSYLLIRIYKEEIIFTKECLIHIKVFGERKLDYDHIKGYKTNKDFYKVISNSPTLKNIEVTRYISKSDDFYTFLTEHFIDLDIAEYQEDLNELLSDSLSGTTLQEREKKLKQAILICHIINWPGVILMLLLIFIDPPYKFLTTVGIVYPLLALIALKYNHLISFDERNNSAHPSICYGFDMPLIGLIMRAVWDANILHFESLLIPSIILFAVLFVVLLSGKHQFEFNGVKNFATTIFCFAFIYGYCITSVIVINYLYDTSPKHIYKSKVLSKYITTGKHDSYYLVLQK